MPAESSSRRYRRFWGADPARDVDEELAFHIAMREEELRRAGMTEAQAREATMQRFGKLTDVREECEELGRERVALRRRADRLDALRQDLRYAVRTLLANRGFALVVALTMAIGIGATTAVFSVVYGVLLRPLPYRDADRLVRLWSANTSRDLPYFSVSPADLRDWRAGTRVFTALAPFERQREATLVKRTEPQSVVVAAVAPELFQMLGTGALHGRALLADDARPGAPAAAVMSHDLWSARFGSDPTLVGGTVMLDGAPVTVVGVMPPRFEVPGSPAQLWTPLSLAGASDDHGARSLRVLGRLAPGVPIERAKAELDAVAAKLARDYPATNGPWSVTVMSVPEMLVGPPFRRAMLVLLGVVAFVLLIACANAANLQLARAAARKREIALRAALGAGRGRIVRQLLTESVLLSVVAGAAGLALAYGGLALLRAVGDETVPRLGDVKLDAPVLAFTALVTLGSGILFGLLPALGASRVDSAETLKEGGRGEGMGAVGRGVRSALVVAEVALSLVLLIGAGLLMRSFVRLQAIDLGFDGRGVWVAQVRAPEGGPSATPSGAPADSAARARAQATERDRMARFHAAVLDAVARMPGVTAAAAVSSAPFAGPNAGLVFARTDRPINANETPPDADFRVATPGYLRTLGIRLVRGRDFTAQDGPDAPAVMLINESMARRYWPGEDPIGRQVRVGDLAAGPPVTVVGVVGDVRYYNLETPESRPTVYFSALARPQRALTLAVRGGDAASVAAGIRQAVAAQAPGVPAPAVFSLDELVGQATATRRFALVLFGVFAATALVLATVGIYGVLSYLVRQRMRELAIRVALGAPSRALVSSVVSRAMRLVAAGLAIGLVGAWWLTRLMAALLYGVSATDLPTFAAVPVLLAVVAAVASLIPARRATRADPLMVLRDG